MENSKMTSASADSSSAREASSQERAHALLSPSSAGRWLRCTPSALRESRVEEVSSSYSLEGSLAHALGAKKLKESLGLPTQKEEEEIEDLSPQYYCGEMEELIEGYAAYVSERRSERGGRLLVEQRLDLGHLVPESFGTADAIIASEGEVEIIDLKYGKGVKVSARENPQMKIYALGVIDLLDWKYDFERVRMTIYQPRLGNLSTWETTVSELTRWAEEELRPAARLAAAGKGLYSAGDWCRFCKIRESCRHLALESLQQWALHDDGRDAYTPEEKNWILEQLPRMKKWISDFEDSVLASALGGEKIPGYKVAEGRAVRKIVDPDGLRAVLSAEGFGEEDILRPREMRTLTDLEKLVGRSRFGKLAGETVRKGSGKPTLVPETDPRQEIELFPDL